MKRSQPMRRKAPKRHHHDTTGWWKVRADVLERARGLCEAGIRGHCQVRAVHVHHRHRRSQGGLDVPGNLLALCFRCHEYIHGHPAESYEQGWLVRSSVSDLTGE